MLRGEAVEVSDPDVRAVVLDQLRSERQLEEVWPSAHVDALFELRITSCLLMRTRDGSLRAGPTVWRDAGG